MFELGQILISDARKRDELIMRLSRIIGLTVLVSVALPVAAPAETKLSVPVTLLDGTVATPYDRCGAVDVCGEVKYANGDFLTIYAEGAAAGQEHRFRWILSKPNAAKFLDYDLEAAAFSVSEYNKERDLVATYVLYHGQLRLDFYTNKDGTLKPRFTIGAAAPTSPPN